MRVNAANDLDFGAMAKRGGSRVMVRMGWQRYTLTPEEARQLIRQVQAAIEELDP